MAEKGNTLRVRIVLARPLTVGYVDLKLKITIRVSVISD